MILVNDDDVKVSFCSELCRISGYVNGAPQQNELIHVGRFPKNVIEGLKHILEACEYGKAGEDSPRVMSALNDLWTYDACENVKMLAQLIDISFFLDVKIAMRIFCSVLRCWAANDFKKGTLILKEDDER